MVSCTRKSTIKLCASHRLMQSQKSQSRILHLKKFQNDVHLVDDGPFSSFWGTSRSCFSSHALIPSSRWSMVSWVAALCLQVVFHCQALKHFEWVKLGIESRKRGKRGREMIRGRGGGGGGGGQKIGQAPKFPNSETFGVSEIGNVWRDRGKKSATGSRRLRWHAKVSAPPPPPVECLPVLVLIDVHKNHQGLSGTGSPGRPPRLSHSGPWAALKSPQFNVALRPQRP